MAGQRPIEKGIFEVDGQEQSVTLYNHQIAWAPQNNDNEDISELVTLKLQDVLHVKISCKSSDVNQNKLSPGCCVLTAKEKSWESLLIYFAQDKKNTGVWKRSSIQFFHAEIHVLRHWLKILQSCINDLYRPKNLLFFVNPFGGKRKALKIFEDKVKPILELCHLKWTTIHTQRRNHVTDTLLNMTEEKLKEYDAIVAVGGDGTVCEVVTGLLMRGLENSPELSTESLKLAPAHTPVAVIPAGSSNALAITLHGTGDVVTAAIHLVLGGSVPLDVAAIHNNEGIARFIVGQMSYGHLADTLLHSEDLRWMGPKRYDWAGFRKFVSHATYQGSVDMKISVEDFNKSPTVCDSGNGCGECLAPDEEKKKTSEWRRVEGQFLGISGANISCRCALSPHGMAPYAHLSDGMLDLILVKKASRLSHLRYLLRTAGDSRRAFALPFVERYRVEEFVFTPVQCCTSFSSRETISGGPLMDSGSSNSIAACGCDTRKQEKTHSVWNCDGELVMQPSVRVTVHRNLIRIMSRYKPDPRNRPSF